MQISAAFVNAKSNDRSGYFQAYDHAQNVFKTAGTNSYIYCAADSTAFNLLYLKQVKGLFRDVTAYDRNLNILDLAPFKKIRVNGVFERPDELAIEKKIAMENPGRVYYMDMAVFPELALRTQPWGILHKLLPEGTNHSASGKLCALWATRGIYCKNRNDIYCRENADFYLVRLAEYAALSGDRQRFEACKMPALKAAADIPTTQKNIAYIYFYIFRDGQMCVDHLEKAAALEPYYVPVIRLLIELYRSGGFTDKAKKWQDHLDGLNIGNKESI
ncbi:MAG: hypothetical protein LLG37_11155 [Spirochaetia bacterium]|nr:hypothetical protein [Spirochaetia bacterium]